MGDIGTVANLGVGVGTREGLINPLALDGCSWPSSNLGTPTILTRRSKYHIIHIKLIMECKMFRVIYDYRDRNGFISTDMIDYKELKLALAFIRELSLKKNIIGKPILERIWKNSFYLTESKKSIINRTWWIHINDYHSFRKHVISPKIGPIHCGFLWCRLQSTYVKQEPRLEKSGFFYVCCLTIEYLNRGREIYHFHRAMLGAFS